MSRSRNLTATLVAITVVGVTLPHLLMGEVAGSLPGLLIGIAVGIGCLRLALVARSRAGRLLGTVGIAAATVAPIAAFWAQEAAERATGLEAAHAEPSLVAAMLAQAPLAVLALLTLRLLLSVVRTVVRVLARTSIRGQLWRRASVPNLGSTAFRPRSFALVASTGGRAPPSREAFLKLAPPG